MDFFSAWILVTTLNSKNVPNYFENSKEKITRMKQKMYQLARQEWCFVNTLLPLIKKVMFKISPLEKGTRGLIKKIAKIIFFY